jgi:hypothetical protein
VDNGWLSDRLNIRAEETLPCILGLHHVGWGADISECRGKAWHREGYSEIGRQGETEG